MLTKTDLEQIDLILQKRLDDVIQRKVKPIVDTSIQSAFEDFYDHIFEPHATQSVQQHQEIVTEIIGLKRAVNDLEEETEEIKEYIKEHDVRIANLERKTVSLKN